MAQTLLLHIIAFNAIECYCLFTEFWQRHEDVVLICELTDLYTIVAPSRDILLEEVSFDYGLILDWIFRIVLIYSLRKR